MSRIGSLFAGYGGLELGVQAVLGGAVAWHSEIEPAPSRILAHHWPDIPNHGDITRIDFRDVEPVAVLTGGFPCQDVSHAGKRAGIAPGTRSGLWSEMHRAIQVLRPELVVAENVRGLLSADAASDMEPCPWCVGDGGTGRPLRALGAVLGDLADIGYDAAWAGVRASDVGAPHGRFRVFILAWPADTESDSGRLSDGISQPVGDAPVAAWGGSEQQRVGTGPVAAAELGEPTSATAADPDGLGHERGGGARDGWPGPADDGQPDVADPDGSGREGSEPARRRHLPDRGAPPDADDGADHGQRSRPGPRSGGAAPPDTGRGQLQRRTDRRGVAGPEGTGAGEGVQRERRGHSAGDGGAATTQWGPYGPAVERWGAVVGRVAPAPTEEGAKGGQRLSPAFVEWMMGLPAGHVTAVPGVTRNDQLKALGNGVVPQQAAHAIRALLQNVSADLGEVVA